MPRRFFAAAIAIPAATVGALALPGAEARAQSPQCIGPKSDTIAHVFVDGIENSNGLIAITLYGNQKSKFLSSDGHYWVDRVKARKGSVRTCIYLPKPGAYVIAVYHDENGNKRLDRSTFGPPTEAYGFTNNPGTLFGLPSFGRVLTSFPKSGLATRITLTYP
jgi:uncharacterized protein (DUF2141 family)